MTFYLTVITFFCNSDFISHNLDFVYLNFEKKKTSEFNMYVYIYAINMSFNSHKKTDGWQAFLNVLNKLQMSWEFKGFKDVIISQNPFSDTFLWIVNQEILFSPIRVST